MTSEVHKGTLTATIFSHNTLRTDSVEVEWHPTGCERIVDPEFHLTLNAIMEIFRLSDDNWIWAYGHIELTYNGEVLHTMPSKQPKTEEYFEALQGGRLHQG